MKIEYGQEVGAQFSGDGMTKTESIQNYANSEGLSAYKRISVRVRVKDYQDEMTEYLKFTNILNDLKKRNKIVRGDRDPNLRPCFIVEYPKNDNTDGIYFIIRCYTEIV